MTLCFGDVQELKLGHKWGELEEAVKEENKENMQERKLCRAPGS